MVRHIVMFNFKEGFSPEENRKNAEQVKRLLEALPGVIPGIAEFNVIIDILPVSNKDLVLNTLFKSEEALAAYQVHPEHVKAVAFIGSVMQGRVCVDYHE